MLTLQKLKAKIENYKEPKLLVTVVQLPSGAYETLVNNDKLESKFEYLLSAYDEELRLKTKKDIKLLDCIIL